MELRSGKKQHFSGFTIAEVEKMEQLLNESKVQSMGIDFCKNLAKKFNCSSNRAGRKPNLKWTEIQNWFKTKQENLLSKETSSEESDEAKEMHAVSDGLNQSKATKTPEIFEGQYAEESSHMEFEVRSPKDKAWYDVEKFLTNRTNSSGEFEVYVRYVGFGSEDDEWVNVKNDVRQRSIAVEHSDCHKLKVGDLVVCFQETQDHAKYYDAHVVGIQRKLHDVRGCRCLFLIRYDHDSTQEKVHLRRLYCQPNILARLDSK